MNKQIDEYLQSAEKIAILIHSYPDTDAFSSSIAVLDYINNKFPNKHVDIFGECDYVADDYLPILHGVKINPDYTPNYDLSICLDCGDRNRFSKYDDIFSNSKHTVCIDHHDTNEGFAELNIIEQSSSTCEILFSMMENNGYSLTRRIAGILYAGIITDTNNLSVPKVQSSTHMAIAKMIDMGVNVNRIRNYFFAGNSLIKIKLMTKAYESLKLYFNNQLMLMSLTNEDFKEIGATHEDTNGIINQLFTLKTAKIALLIMPKTANINYVSMRCKEGYDVGSIATVMGGGGHTGAAAFNIAENEDDIVKTLLLECKKQIDNNIENDTPMF